MPVPAMFTGIALADAFLKNRAGPNRHGGQRRIRQPPHRHSTKRNRRTDGSSNGVSHRGRRRCRGHPRTRFQQPRRFPRVDLATLGRHSSLCIGKMTDQPHGGATMAVDSIGVTSVAVRHLVPFVDTIMKRNNWRPNHIFTPRLFARRFRIETAGYSPPSS